LVWIKFKVGVGFSWIQSVSGPGHGGRIYPAIKLFCAEITAGNSGFFKAQIFSMGFAGYFSRLDSNRYEDS